MVSRALLLITTLAFCLLAVLSLLAFTVSRYFLVTPIQIGLATLTVAMVFEIYSLLRYESSILRRNKLTNFVQAIRSRVFDPTNTRSDVLIMRNPFDLLRGSEYTSAHEDRLPVTDYDMNLTATDHQAVFFLPADAGRPEFIHLHTALVELKPSVRLNAVFKALAINPSSVYAYILLAEEQSPSVSVAERVFTTAMQNVGIDASTSLGEYWRDRGVVIYIKRRLAMCARKLGRIHEAEYIFRGLCRERHPIANHMNIHENWIEALLEMRAYSRVQRVLDHWGTSCPSATLYYTAALLKARSVGANLFLNGGLARELTPEERTALVAMEAAIVYNPYVPKYLLGEVPLITPPEHYVKRGNSEALAYAYTHLQHWNRIRAARTLLYHLVRGTFPSSFAVECVEFSTCPHAPLVDCELLKSSKRTNFCSWNSISPSLACIFGISCLGWFHYLLISHGTGHVPTTLTFTDN